MKISYTIPEAAEATGLSAKSIRDAIARRDLMCRRPTPGRVIVMADDLKAWLEASPSERAS